MTRAKMAFKQTSLAYQLCIRLTVELKTVGGMLLTFLLELGFSLRLKICVETSQYRIVGRDNIEGLVFAFLLVQRTFQIGFPIDKAQAFAAKCMAARYKEWLLIRIIKSLHAHLACQYLFYTFHLKFVIIIMNYLSLQPSMLTRYSIKCILCFMKGVWHRIRGIQSCFTRVNERNDFNEIAFK